MRTDLGRVGVELPGASLGPDYFALLELAVDEARTGLRDGGIPIGSVLVARDVDSFRLLGRGHNRRVQDDDASAHAEVVAFRRAGRRASYDDTIIVTTLAPCWFCSGMIRQFGIPTVIVGESETFQGGVGWLRETGIEVIDLNSKECKKLLRSFIQERPEIWNEDIGA